MSGFEPLPAAQLARIAAAAFADRQAEAARLVRNGGMLRGEAERRLAPWLAIACLAGADLPELDEALAELREKDPDDVWTFSDAQARALLASDICPRARWVPLLAKARDAALRRAETVAHTQHPDRDTLMATARALRGLADGLSHDPSGRIDVPAYQELETTR
jgi:hypothetical protein